ncbi:hypothetical protein GB937_000940 [Aspergillus fischeri]|nr:hypothetical protein GB937_000940 [Aspergillus fischeri]
MSHHGFVLGKELTPLVTVDQFAHKPWATHNVPKYTSSPLISPNTIGCSKGELRCGCGNS